ncbi:fumarylacetoacetate hydrolase family protein [Pseudonocardia sp. NPDC049635]|uniref:fumarylacetoacetate hydrolase family protein n=1 Tax=Pseudonocardia sp. NPDC049635 TaxID=3155506 RepID=UPI0033EAAD16
MKYVMFSVGTAEARPGLIDGDQVIDLRVAIDDHLRRTGAENPIRTRIVREITGDLADLLQLGTWGATLLEQSVHTESLDNPARFSLDEVRLHAPLQPRRLRDCSVFEGHARDARARRGEEVPDVWFEMPIYYKGNPGTVVGPEAVVRWPEYSTYMDYELEIGIVIARGGRDIPVEKALDHILGLTIINDFSARDIQRREMAGGLGPAKGKDFATGLGPWICTLDELPPLDSLEMTATVNGELWSTGSTSDMHFGFAEIVAHASAGEPLVAGEVIGTGTCNGGSGYENDRRLMSGAVVELAVTGLGTLRNIVEQ